MVLFKNVGNFLKQVIKRYSGLIVSFLGHFKEPLQVLYLQNPLVNAVAEEALTFFNQLDVRVCDVDLIEQFLFLYPSYL